MTLSFAGLFYAAYGVAGAQNAPTQATPSTDSAMYVESPTSPGFQLPTSSGSLTYSLGVNEGVTFGYDGSDQTFYSTVVSGNLAYVSASKTHPFSALYSGGYNFGNNGQPSSPYQSLALSQTLSVGKWTFLMGDFVSYYPRTPIGTLSGLPGLGDVSVTPPPESYLDNALQSNYSPQVVNAVSGSVSRALTSRTSVLASGTYGIQRFVGDYPGLNNDSSDGSVSLVRRLDARSTFSGGYLFTRFTYPAYLQAYTSQGGSLTYTRQFTRAFQASFTGGPLWTQSTGEPTDLNYNLGANGAYTSHVALFAIGFSRYTNAGSGVSFAVRSNTVYGNATRTFGRGTAVSASTGYSNSTRLPSLLIPQSSYNSLYASGQISRTLHRALSAYASYTIQHQLQSDNAFAVNPLAGNQQTIAVGVVFSPSSIHVGR